VLPSVIGGDGSIAFIGCDEGPGVLNKWLFGQGGGQLYLYLNGPDTGAHFIAQASFLPATNQWYHLALTRRSGVYRAYTNGAQGSIETNSLPIPAINAPLTIGQAQGLFMDGRLDEVSVYNRALEPGEVQAIYEGGSLGKCGLDTGVSISLQARLGAGGKVTILITGGEPGASVSVEATEDFEQWTILGTVVMSQETQTFTDPTPVLPRARFYRAVVNP
jgi:hypothetical protein